VINASTIWLDGKAVPYAQAQVHVAAFTLHYGVGVFEGLRCYRRHDGRTAIFRLGEHIERLFESAAVCSMVIPFSAAQIEEACLETVRANKLQEGYVRPLVFTGAGVLGMGARDNPIQVAVLAFPWSDVLGAEASQRGIRAHVSSFVRAHVNSVMSKAKIVGQYAASVMVKRESQRLGFDEAIMLDADGRVTEGSAENIFMVYRGELWTPPLDLPILGGITRDAVLTLARAAGLRPVERAFTRDMLYAASEIFLTGTATEITPVRELDGRVVGSGLGGNVGSAGSANPEGRPGPVTRQIQQAFAAALRGPGEPHPEWLRYT
jgi:branched-chain amino acid aminotransferase